MKRHVHMFRGGVGFGLALFCVSCMPTLLHAQVLNLPSRQSSPQAAQPEAEGNMSSGSGADEGTAATQGIAHATVHGAWIVTCMEEEQVECFVETQVRRNDAERDLVRLQFTEAEGSETWLKMSLATPNNVMIPQHARLHLGEEVFEAPYTICDSDFCVAEVSVSQPLLQALIGENAGEVVFTVPPAQNTRVPLSLNGFLAALRDMDSQLGESRNLSEQEDG